MDELKIRGLRFSGDRERALARVDVMKVKDAKIINQQGVDTYGDVVSSDPEPALKVLEANCGVRASGQFVQALVAGGLIVTIKAEPWVWPNSEHDTDNEAAVAMITEPVTITLSPQVARSLLKHG